ncbi:MAG: N-acetyltransferase, partial [Calditrichia bacterium]|nr:N-acetyltransferase [Calditrichia bacterium]
ITFEEELVTEEEIKGRLTSTSLPWIVFEENNKILGYAFASEWKSRCAYKYTVECSVYLDRNCKGKGIGKKLYSELLQQLKDLEYHTIIAGIALPNEASVKFHEKFGFEKVAHFKKVDYKFNNFIDVGYWQMIVG